MEKRHIILQEPKNAQVAQDSPVTFFCTKCGKRWENMIIKIEIGLVVLILAEVVIQMTG